ncbi:MAG: glycosyltransferase family 2 protein [Deltaproteobacteria bacterium]|nr:glycosyltransferase family 2 protein [Candidatus Deferrimicrobium borealis]
MFKYNKNINIKQYPYVTIIIAAYNEEKLIKDKIENTLAIAYPREKLEIIIASDGSTDGTNEIVASYQGKGIELLAISERGGKEKSQKEAVKQSKGNILVFTDVATILDSSAVEQIVSNFADPAIGCVSSEDRVMGKNGKQSGENFYVRYEMWLRRLESRVSSPVGLSGSFFAARRVVCEEFSGDLDSDFRTLLNSVKRGMRGTCDKEAIGYYIDLSDQRKEFDRKVRTVLRGITVFFNNIEFLNIFKYGLFSYQLLCHKLLRWLVPYFLIILFIVNIPLAFVSTKYLFLLVAQLLFYGVGVFSLFYDLYSSERIFIKIPIYFVTVNASILVAWFRYLTGQRVLLWTPSER